MRLFKKFTGCLLCAVGAISINFGVSAVTAYASEDDGFYLGGFPAGFMLNTQTVEVIGLCDVSDGKTSRCPAREGGIMTGDIVKSVNGKEIKSAKDLTKAAKEDYGVYNLEVLRGGETLSIKIIPVKDVETGKNRLGLLVRDSVNGIGTVTYVDRANKKFGSLGHAVANEAGEPIEINDGTLLGCTIYDVKRGTRGNPGELKGIFDNTTRLGKIVVNTRCGIFGDIAEDFDYSKLTQIEKSSASAAKMGKATMYSTIYGEKSVAYDISIVKVDEANKDNRNFVIKVDDEKLLSESGGIVQGMSGSPIVQDGKLIGAVTHVFINDPTRGYGISLDKMTSSY